MKWCVRNWIFITSIAQENLRVKSNVLYTFSRIQFQELGTADATYSLQRDLETQSALIDRSVLFEPGYTFCTLQGTGYMFCTLQQGTGHVFCLVQLHTCVLHFTGYRVHVLHFTAGYRARVLLGTAYTCVLHFTGYRVCVFAGQRSLFPRLLQAALWAGFPCSNVNLHKYVFKWSGEVSTL